MKMKTKKCLFKKIKVLHPAWVKADNYLKERIEKNLETVFVELEGLGVDRTFSQSLLFFGKEFIESEQERSEYLQKECQRIFNVRPETLTFAERKALRLAQKNNVSVFEISVSEEGKVGIIPK